MAAEQDRNVISNPLYEDHGFMDEDEEPGGGYLDVSPEEAAAAASESRGNNLPSMPRNSFSAFPSFHAPSSAVVQKPAPYQRLVMFVIAALIVIAAGAVVAAIFAINNKDSCSTTSSATTGQSTGGNTGNTGGKSDPVVGKSLICSGVGNSSCSSVGVTTEHWCTGHVKIDEPSSASLVNMASLNEKCPRKSTMDLSELPDLFSVGVSYSCEGPAMTLTLMSKSGQEHQFLLSCGGGSNRRKRSARQTAFLNPGDAYPPMSSTDTPTQLSVDSFGDMAIYSLDPVLSASVCSPNNGQARCGGPSSAPYGQCTSLESGGFKCTCNTGFALTADGSKCQDVDECKTNNGGCSKACVNSIGSFECSCGNGKVERMYNEDCDGGQACTSECECPAGMEPDGNLGCKDSCGNGVVDFGETCDSATDPNCNQCQCAPGFEPSGKNDGKCKVSCGNGVLQFGEQCDDSSTSCVDCACVGGTAPNGNGGCTATCGDGVTSAALHEECDSSQHCTDCHCDAGFEPNSQGACVEKCGNGKVDADSCEQCDSATDTNCVSCRCAPGYQPSANGDGTCKKSCGNNVVEFGEACDKTQDDKCVECQCVYGHIPDGSGGCKASCGDTVFSPEFFESCEVHNDHCTDCLCDQQYYPDGQGGCKPKCGNSDVDFGEECDLPGDANCVNCKCAEGYEPTQAGGCQGICGNARLDFQETCDDPTDQNCVDCTCKFGFLPDGKGKCTHPCTDGTGGTDHGVYCDNGADNCEDCQCVAGYSPDGNGGCTKNCGNGALDFGEECDDPNDTHCTNCQCAHAYEADPAKSGSCRAMCGNGKLDLLEECDKNDPTCVGCSCAFGMISDGNRGCKSPCGDGILQEVEFGEACDSPQDSCVRCQCMPGNLPDGKGACIQACGNGKVETQFGETCDDPTDNLCHQCNCEPGSEPDATSTGCQSLCGNARLDTDVFETCDDGSAECVNCRCISGYGSDGKGGCAEIITCGNDKLDRQYGEQCDDKTDTNCVDCQCAPKYESNNKGQCIASCGNGVVQPNLGETCDDSTDTNCVNCRCKPGFETDDDGGCRSKCGNNVIDDGENCDSTDSNCVSCLCKLPSFVPDKAGGCTTCGNGQWDKGTEDCDANTASCVKCKCATGFESDGFGSCRVKCTCDESLTDACVGCQCLEGFVATGDGGCNALCGNNKLDDGEECDADEDPNCEDCVCLTAPDDQGGCTKSPSMASTQQWVQINKWVGVPDDTEWHPCYRKTGSFNVANWYSDCGYKGRVIVLVRTNKGSSNERLIGGYMDDFRMSYGYYNPGNSFLFSLTNNFKHEVYRNSGNAMYTNSGYGPTFGGGHDLYINSDGTSGYCNLGHTYACRTGSYQTSTCQNDFCGTYNFAPSEIEIYYRVVDPEIQLINTNQLTQINKWIGIAPSSQWKMCYRHSDYKGYVDYRTLHAKCDAKGELVTVALLNKGTSIERLVGGYQSASLIHWGYYYDKDAFLFSLTTNRQYLQYQNFGNALYMHQDYYTTFGSGHDLYLGPSTPYCNLGNTYKCGTGLYGQTECRNEFCGTYNPTVTDFEVYYRPLVTRSMLASKEEFAMINTWAGLAEDTKWKLCFRQSDHTHGNTFYERCKWKGPTITVAHLNVGTDHERRVGGYASWSWGWGGGYYTTPDSFLFSLTNKHQYEMYRNEGNSLYWTGSYPPTFGGGHDLFLGTDPNNAYCNLGHTYRCRSGVYGSNACREEFCGTYNPTVTDYEVFYRESDDEPTLVTTEQIEKINGWIGKDKSFKWRVCYRHSENHQQAFEDYADKCFGKGESVTVALLNPDTNDMRLVGGYTSLELRNHGGSYYGDSSAFLFSLTNNQKYTQYQNHGYAMYSSGNYFPTFGGGHDLYLGAGTAYCNLGYTYRCATGSYTQAVCRNEFCGAYNPQLQDFEVLVAEHFGRR